MGYSKAPTRHRFGPFDFGGGADDFFSIISPTGRDGGILVDYGVEGVTEAFNGDTLDPQLSVGTAADRDKYGEEITVNPAVDAGMSLRSQFETIGKTLSGAKIGDYITADGLNIPASGAGIHAIASTGANLTGQGVLYADIVWPD
ncbi:MAG: hypothetical protein IT548_05475 [Alphaproteobacteria bacterium]|nr:hypothetical protein [Alphaproteobacteria bacterium]